MNTVKPPPPVRRSSSVTPSHHGDSNVSLSFIFNAHGVFFVQNIRNTITKTNFTHFNFIQKIINHSSSTFYPCHHSCFYICIIHFIAQNIESKIRQQSCFWLLLYNSHHLFPLSSLELLSWWPGKVDYDLFLFYMSIRIDEENEGRSFFERTNKKWQEKQLIVGPVLFNAENECPRGIWKSEWKYNIALVFLRRVWVC